MYSYKTLEDINLEVLHETFVKAFSDYQVKIDLSFSKFEEMMKRRGYVSELSVGAFKDDELVGFILNGVRYWDDKLTSYDTGTGVVYDHRKQGITSAMFKYSRDIMINRNVEQYLLEVIKENTVASELYKKQGFEVTRSFQCFQMEKEKYNPITTTEVKEVDNFTLEEWNYVKSFWDNKPSWQNSIDSVNDASNTFIYLAVFSENNIVGYGIIDKKTGDIPQIAVDKRYRGKGMGRSIITALIKYTEADSIRVINVDDKNNTLKEFLSNIGCEEIVSQYEMILNL